jgi:hypothetical protein
VLDELKRLQGSAEAFFCVLTRLSLADCPLSHLPGITDPRNACGDALPQMLLQEASDVLDAHACGGDVRDLGQVIAAGQLGAVASFQVLLQPAGDGRNIRVFGEVLALPVHGPGHRSLPRCLGCAHEGAVARQTTGDWR